MSITIRKNLREYYGPAPLRQWICFLPYTLKYSFVLSRKGRGERFRIIDQAVRRKNICKVRITESEGK